ncbi:MAG: hypothetical protein U9R00_01700 [Patescibacteria group bacterium]|nr:hypothetical protein [Patescibacteria group bacterium]
MKKEMKKSQKLLNKITTGQIKPSPRWHFILQNYVFWGVFLIFAVLGSIAFSIILYAAAENDFDLFPLFGSKIEFLFSVLPLLWILFLGIFSTISITGIRHTKTGYRYPLLKILSFNILLSIFLGTLFFYTGGAEKIEQIFAENIPVYESFEERRVLRWSNPENGFLSGIILENKNKEIILIKDFNGMKWKVDIQDASIRLKASLKSGEKIKIIGEILEDNIFIAKEIRKWESPRSQQKNRK